ncbi:MAG TPA: hypothetical protein VFG08_04080, partial [Candidatus Polarisedimenticolia bacterium]|nr:hypothetical protein [Candidatus Polarisedimenticolia bacterium]
VGALLQAHSRGQADHARTLWALVMYQLWHDRFAQRNPARRRTASSLCRGKVSSLKAGVTSI